MQYAEPVFFLATYYDRLVQVQCAQKPIPIFVFSSTTSIFCDCLTDVLFWGCSADSAFIALTSVLLSSPTLLLILLSIISIFCAVGRHRPTRPSLKGSQRDWTKSEASPKRLDQPQNDPKRIGPIPKRSQRDWIKS